MKLATDSEHGIGFSIAQEDVHCLSCESIIPKECVQARVDPSNGYGPTTQTVKAYCEHCDRLCQCTRVLRGGNWDVTSSPVIVTDRKIRASFKRRIDELRGNIQREAYSA